MDIKIKLDDQQVQRALNRALRAGRDMSPLMRVVAGHLADGVEQAFEKEQSPDGRKWEPLSAVTLSRRKKGQTNILQVSGDLVQKMVAEHDRKSAQVALVTRYAATHQFGAKKGEFGTTKRGAPIPWGDIPARPFLGLSAATESRIIDDSINFINQQWA